jgi:hypothetical protein
MVLNFHQIIVPTTLVHYEIQTKSVAYECTNNFKSIDNNTIVCAPFLSIQWGKKPVAKHSRSMTIIRIKLTN